MNFLTGLIAFVLAVFGCYALGSYIGEQFVFFGATNMMEKFVLGALAVVIPFFSSVFLSLFSVTLGETINKTIKRKMGRRT